MGLKNVTSKCKAELYEIKSNFPPETTIKIFEKGPVRYLYTDNKGNKMLSISSITWNVKENDWIIGIKKIMNLSLLDVQLSISPKGLVVITERTDDLPRIADCTW